jgi:Zinc finger, C2H2 type
MTNPYKRMYILPEEEYLEYKRYKETVLEKETAECAIDGHNFPNANVLAHHVKTHFEGFKCNICGKVFKTKHALTSHLKWHPPQVQPSTHSMLDPIQPVKTHKQHSNLKFNTTQWLSLE